jgi:hypothetical protein
MEEACPSAFALSLPSMNNTHTHTHTHTHILTQSHTHTHTHIQVCVTKRRAFPKATRLYDVLRVFGENIVTTEGEGRWMGGMGGWQATFLPHTITTRNATPRHPGWVEPLTDLSIYPFHKCTAPHCTGWGSLEAAPRRGLARLLGRQQPPGLRDDAALRARDGGGLGATGGGGRSSGGDPAGR